MQYLSALQRVNFHVTDVRKAHVLLDLHNYSHYNGQPLTSRRVHLPMFGRALARHFDPILTSSLISLRNRMASPLTWFSGGASRLERYTYCWSEKAVDSASWKCMNRCLQLVHDVWVVSRYLHPNPLRTSLYQSKISLL
jgi:hypothetical protein